MGEILKNCWQILGCGREEGGIKVSDLGECIAATAGLGHSCWAVAGTLCGGKVMGTMAQKKRTCILCDVFQRYHRLTGSHGLAVVENFPEEEAKYRKFIKRVPESSDRA